MNIRSLFFCAIICCATRSSIAYFPQDFSQELTTIAFGSCNKHNKPQPIWAAAANNNPDLWIWLGDTIYGDSNKPEILKQKYDQQFNRDDYTAFRKSTPIIGTWDDHDYGKNNGGKEFPIKAESQQLALDFLEEPLDSKRRQQAGLYSTYEFGTGERKVQLFLLDIRYHSEKPGPEADLLGAEQWTWLQRELLNSEARINIIASGIQILPEEHRYEKWANFPQTRDRLLAFIREKEISGVVFVSGDRHIHEISLKDDDTTLYPLAEVTSSGLTHSWRNFPGEQNRYRYGELHTELGFGLIQINWEDATPHLSLQIRDKQNTLVNELRLTLESLSAPKN